MTGDQGVSRQAAWITSFDSPRGELRMKPPGYQNETRDPPLPG